MVFVGEPCAFIIDQLVLRFMGNCDALSANVKGNMSFRKCVIRLRFEKLRRGERMRERERVTSKYDENTLIRTNSWDGIKLKKIIKS